MAVGQGYHFITCLHNVFNNEWGRANEYSKKKRKEKKVYGIWRMGSEANFNKTQGLNIDNKVLPLFADDINAFEK